MTGNEAADFADFAKEFGHYLQGAPAPDWITKGKTFLDREKELKRMKKAKPTAAAQSESRSD